MPNVVYNSFKRDIQNGSINLELDAIKVLLVTAAYKPNRAEHFKRADVTNEVVDSGTYYAGGAWLANKTVRKDDENDLGVFDADDVSWDGTIAARGAVLYRDHGGPSEDELIAYIDFGKTITSSNGTFTIPWDKAGILLLGEFNGN